MTLSFCTWRINSANKLMWGEEYSIFITKILFVTMDTVIAMTTVLV